MKIKEFSVRTRLRAEFVNITQQVQAAAEEMGVDEGLLTIFVPHTTAGVTINENADPDVTSDILGALDRLVPWNGPYRHSEGNTAAHLKASLMGFSAQAPVQKGQLLLGIWQGVYFCEFDGPRNRTVRVVAAKT